MRVTQSMYYDNLYGTNNSNLNKRLFDVNKQIASGLKIHYASDDVAVFTETMRLDNEMTTLGQVKKSTQSAYKVSNQTDDILNEFDTSLNRMRTLLLTAANGTNGDTSLDAIAAELRGIEDHFMVLANTSINGQYLFSGSATDIKPINSDGSYQGNDKTMNAFLGSNTHQSYNISGAELFLGEEIGVRRQVTSNVVQSLNSPAIGTTSTVTGDSKMSEFMGDFSAPNNHYFYLRGVKSDGTVIKEVIPMTDAHTVDNLLKTIGDFYGNTANVDVVNVTLNNSGQIVIEDKLKGSSKLDFHLVGATDFSGGALAANFNTLNDPSATTDYLTASSGAGSLYIKEFMVSGLSSATGVTGVEGIIYDRTEFLQKGTTLSSNNPQITTSGNAYATDSTKLSEVFTGAMIGTTLKLQGLTIGGVTPYDVEINFNDPTTYTSNGNTYNIFNADSGRTNTNADDMTYRQLMDVINMAVTGTTPGTTPSLNDIAIENSNSLGVTSLSFDGKIKFSEQNVASTSASIALYDSRSGNFAAGDSAVTFNSNNALTISDSKTDFFKSIDEMITAVENHKTSPDGSVGDIRNIGINNSIRMMDNLQDHISRSHSKVGAQSNSLSNSLERTEMLELSTMTLRSSTIDTDLARASLTLTQLTLNYEAMLSTVGRVSKLSLVNYL